MRILFVSNLFPPDANGGYEQLCHQVSVELARRGHTIDIVTSLSRSPESAYFDCELPFNVHRCLHLEVLGGNVHSMIRLLLHRARLETENRDHVRRIIAGRQPEVAMIWGMWNVSRSVPALIERLLPSKVAYYLCDYWPSLPTAYQQQWEHGARRRTAAPVKRLIAKPLLARLRREPTVRLEFRHPICVSRAVRLLLVNKELPIGHAKIVHLGTHAEDFVAAGRQHALHANGDSTLKLLYAGRLTATKGVHTAIVALSKVLREGNADIQLDIVGSGESDYERSLRQLVEQAELQRHIHFVGKVPHSAMPAVMAQHDVLLFPSEWEEPFAHTVLEAMATGLAVIGTETGGTPEVLMDGKTGLTYPAGDADALAKQILRLRHDDMLRQHLAKAGQAYVLEHFTLRQTVDKLEGLLESVACGFFDKQPSI